MFGLTQAPVAQAFRPVPGSTLASAGDVPDDDRQSLGKRGEDLACRELERRGYAVLARRYRTRLGEIDLIALDGETVVFVEVKARRGRAFGRAGEAVGPRKQRRIAQIAADFLTRRCWGGRPCRFDVVEVEFSDRRTHATVYPGAFGAPW